MIPQIHPGLLHERVTVGAGRLGRGDGSRSTLGWVGGNLRWAGKLGGDAPEYTGSTAGLAKLSPDTPEVTPHTRGDGSVAPS